nr:MAG TPA_asm: hypothetical protein [Caudoviricetes sp.]
MTGCRQSRIGCPLKKTPTDFFDEKSVADASSAKINRNKI